MGQRQGLPPEREVTCSFLEHMEEPPWHGSAKAGSRRRGAILTAHFLFSGGVKGVGGFEYGC